MEGGRRDRRLASGIARLLSVTEIEGAVINLLMRPALTCMQAACGSDCRPNIPQTSSHSIPCRAGGAKEGRSTSTRGPRKRGR